MPAPTLGCQIAPHYSHAGHTDTESDFTDIDSEDERVSQNGAINDDYMQSQDSNQGIEEVETPMSIAKAETQHEHPGAEFIRAASRPTTLTRRGTKGSRRSQAVDVDPVGFWHWKMAGVRLHVLKLWVRTNFILSFAIMAFLCLFWGALFRQIDHMHSLDVWIVDFDGHTAPYQDVEPFVGPFVTRMMEDVLAKGGHHPSYSIRSPADFDHEPLKVRESVYDFKAWAAVIINPNATSLIEGAVREGNASYDPLGACQIIYNSARDQTTASTYIVPSMTMLQKAVLSDFGRAWLTHLLSNASASDLNLSTAPQAISPGIEFTIYDLRPFGPPVATPAVSIGLIYLIILSFFSFTFFLPIHLKYLSPKGHPPLHFYQLIIWRYVATVTSYFLLSLVYSLVSLAFLMPMNRQPASHAWPAGNPNAYGRATFVVYWMVNWVGMTAFGMASENMAMLLGTPWTALWLIFWVISNVATGFYPLPLASRFYRWGYAWPMHNIVEATRQILFDLHPRIGLNIGILFVWVLIGTALFPVMCYFMRWNTARVKKNAAKEQEDWHKKMEKENENPGFMARVTTRGGREETPVQRTRSNV